MNILEDERLPNIEMAPVLFEAQKKRKPDRKGRAMKLQGGAEISWLVLAASFSVAL
jgi:hypothetical protein